MADYIDRIAAIEAMKQLEAEDIEAYGVFIPEGFHADPAIERIESIPSADAKPVVHGKWVASSIPCEEYVCSNCGGACWYYDYQGKVARSNFCPNCGADMRGNDNG